MRIRRPGRRRGSGQRAPCGADCAGTAAGARPAAAARPAARLPRRTGPARRTHPLAGRVGPAVAVAVAAQRPARRRPSRRTSSCSTRCTPPSTETAALRARDRRLICQVRVGTYAGTDPDASRFPAAVRGAAVGRPAGQPVARRTAVGRAGAGARRPVPAVPGQGLRGGGARRRRRVRAPHRLPARLRRPAAVQPAAGRAGPRRSTSPPAWSTTCRRSPRWRPTSTSRSTRSASGCGQCAKLLPFADADKPVFHVEYAGARPTTSA